MKLIGRKTLATEVASQRKGQIDEGIYLAKKIDTLRRTHSELEVQHRTFLSGMEAELKRTTEGLIQGIAQKKAELIEIENERLRLTAPLDDAWEDVKTAQKDSQKQKEELRNITIILDQRESAMNERLKKAKQTLTKINIREHELDRAYVKAEKEREETSLIKEKVTKEKAKQEAYFEKKTQEFFDRESDIKNKEMANKVFSEALTQREQSLTDRERAVEDRYQTLLRTEERINKK